MTRKRFKKLLMAHGHDARSAEKIARCAISYWQHKSKDDFCEPKWSLECGINKYLWEYYRTNSRYEDLLRIEQEFLKKEVNKIANVYKGRTSKNI